MSAPPYMKLYVGDYLGDTHHLGALEHGAYLLLLMAMWRAGGSLPANDANLAKLARCTPDQWADVRGVVLAFFRRSRARLTHKRLTEELGKYESTSGKRSEAGKRGRSEKPNENKAPVAAIADRLLSKTEAIADITRTRTIYSVANATGAEAPKRDLDKYAWDTAVMVLTDQGGMTEKAARTYFGKLLSETGLLARDLLGALGSAMTTGSPDPKGYLRKAAEGVSQRRPAGAAKRVGFV